MNTRSARLGAIAVTTLLVAHVALGIGRLPGKAWARRLDEIERYRRQGAASFLLDSAQLEGAEVIEWIRQNVPPDRAVLWRWPADGALEFTAALIAPRLLVDEREVPLPMATVAGRLLARGTLPSGETGEFVVQGTPTGGLLLSVRPR